MQLLTLLALAALQLAAAQPSMVAGSHALNILKKFAEKNKYDQKFKGHEGFQKSFPATGHEFGGFHEAHGAFPQTAQMEIPDFMKDLVAKSGAAQRGMSPTQMVNDIGENCREVPELIKKSWAASECHENPSEMFYLFKSMLTAFVHKEMGELEALPADFKDKYNQAMARSCSQPSCQKQLQELLDHTMTCEISAVCALESKWLSSKMCQATIGKMVKKTMASQLQDVCAVETGTGTYCNEADVELLFAHPDCWNEIYNPIMGCSPTCKKVWQDFRSKYPVCSNKLAQKATDMQNMVQGVAQSLAVTPGTGGMHVQRSPDEICSDLSFHFAPSRNYADDEDLEEELFGEAKAKAAYPKYQDHARTPTRAPATRAPAQVTAARPAGAPAMWAEHGMPHMDPREAAAMWGEHGMPGMDAREAMWQHPTAHTAAFHV